MFGQVLADIGDNQSIQESLSTFSAHISHIREMALDVTPDSLVLLDELGAATDPEEGGALGVAIVDHFRAAGAFTLASTHLLALKIYGTNTRGVVNASMGFDESTLEPTYRLHIGVPGKSAGLDIATRLGMPEYIMKRARESLSDHERGSGPFFERAAPAARMTRARRRTTSGSRRSWRHARKRLAAEWERREAAKLKELERRTEQVLAKFEEQAQETIDRSGGMPGNVRLRSRRSGASPKSSASCAKSWRLRCFPRRRTRGRANCGGRRSRRARAYD